MQAVIHKQEMYGDYYTFEYISCRSPSHIIFYFFSSSSLSLERNRTKKNLKEAKLKIKKKTQHKHTKKKITHVSILQAMFFSLSLVL